MFTSQLRANEFVIDDDNFRAHAPDGDEPIIINGEPRLRGLIPRDRNLMPEGCMGFAAKFSLPIIPRSEWADRIEEMEKTKSRLSDIVEAAGIESLDQNGTNYCWANGVITAMETIRAVQGQPYIKLSSASVAAMIKKGRNEGGWGGDALAYVVEHGVAAVDTWPANSRDYRKYDNEESRESRKNFTVPEWWDLKNRNFDQLMTCLLLRIPVAVGYNWWRHEVCAMDPVVLGAMRFGIRIRNSWGAGYGDNGFAVLNESKGTPDDAVGPRVVDEFSR